MQWTIICLRLFMYWVSVSIIIVARPLLACRSELRFVSENHFVCAKDVNDGSWDGYNDEIQSVVGSNMMCNEHNRFLILPWIMVSSEPKNIVRSGIPLCCSCSMVIPRGYFRSRLSLFHTEFENHECLQRELSSWPVIPLLHIGFFQLSFNPEGDGVSQTSSKSQRALQNRYKIYPGPHLFLPISLPPHPSAQPSTETTLITPKSFIQIQTRNDKMQFTAVVVAALACASSASAFIPYGMSGCGNQAGLVNVGALNQNNCGFSAGPGAMSCGNQAGLINVGLLNSNNCAVSTPRPFSANDSCLGKTSHKINRSLILHPLIFPFGSQGLEVGCSHHIRLCSRLTPTTLNRCPLEFISPNINLLLFLSL
ncbi:putative signal peptide protein [Puccinia sorghi]|uniref:Putative signal peptide protein n=1 Tax=Puccinia sorghi TaxID=27349 RepID=A0A0L6U9D8_9BASI|nr:putative signal peptide protein [Puccinia sorghi]